jgi:hypothetical protein
VTYRTSDGMAFTGFRAFRTISGGFAQVKAPAQESILLHKKGEGTTMAELTEERVREIVREEIERWQQERTLPFLPPEFLAMDKP